MKRTIASMFPNASLSCQNANPQLSHLIVAKIDSLKSSSHRRGNMNRTEKEFAVILEAMKRNGEILRYEYEGITLRWAGIRYTPDFVVFNDVDSLLDHRG